MDGWVSPSGSTAMKASDIQIRDPFVLPVPRERCYYLFGTTDKDVWNGPGTGFDCYHGKDLENWEGPVAAFRPPPGFWATTQFWAPEVHAYQDAYYMLASFKADGVRRGTQILAAEKPAGPYAPLTSGPVTPSDWECLDGTLFIDAQGGPWIVFCHSWDQVGDGAICAMRLSSDLTRALDEPRLLFHASDAPWATSIKANGVEGFVTDGPFLHRASDGSLLMLWSSFRKDESRCLYAQGVAKSPSGDIAGPWLHDAAPLYGDNGGHGMLFRTCAGELMLTFHSPNNSPHERPVFLGVQERGGTLALR